MVTRLSIKTVIRTKEDKLAEIAKEVEDRTCPLCGDSSPKLGRAFREGQGAFKPAKEYVEYTCNNPDCMADWVVTD